jgi:hypothetical protein
LGDHYLFSRKDNVYGNSEYELAEGQANIKSAPLAGKYIRIEKTRPIIEKSKLRSGFSKVKVEVALGQE